MSSARWRSSRAQAIPGVDGAGVTLIDTSGATPSVKTWAVTAEFVEEIDKLQYIDLQEGPCITCMQSRRPTVSGSLGSDRRWPHFGGGVARMGVHSALALPMMVGDQLIGAINTYARSRDAFGEHAVELGSQFAGPAAVSVYNAQLLDRAQERTKQLQHALGTRAVIDQAIGIIRARSGVGAGGGVRPARPDEPGRERQAAHRRRAAGGRGGAARHGAAARLSYVGDAANSAIAATNTGRACRSVIRRRATSVRCSPLARA